MRRSRKTSTPATPSNAGTGTTCLKTFLLTPFGKPDLCSWDNTTSDVSLPTPLLVCSRSIASMWRPRPTPSSWTFTPRASGVAWSVESSPQCFLTLAATQISKRFAPLSGANAKTSVRYRPSRFFSWTSTTGSRSRHSCSRRSSTNRKSCGSRPAFGYGGSTRWPTRAFVRGESRDSAARPPADVAPVRGSFQEASEIFGSFRVAVVVTRRKNGLEQRSDKSIYTLITHPADCRT